MSDKFDARWPRHVGIPQSAPVAVAKLVGVLAWHAGDDPKKLGSLEAWYESLARIIEAEHEGQTATEAWRALESVVAGALADGLRYGHWLWEN